MSVTLGIVVVILSFVTVVLVAVLSFRNADKAYLTLNRLHKRQSEQLDSVLDRLMTIRWEDLVSMKALDEPDEGGFFPPGPLGNSADDEDDDTHSRGWGALRDLKFPKDREARRSDEQELLDEDFPEEVEPKV